MEPNNSLLWTLQTPRTTILTDIMQLIFENSEMKSASYKVDDLEVSFTQRVSDLLYSYLRILLQDTCNLIYGQTSPLIRKEVRSSYLTNSRWLVKVLGLILVSVRKRFTGSEILMNVIVIESADVREGDVIVFPWQNTRSNPHLEMRLERYFTSRITYSLGRERVVKFGYCSISG